MNWGFVAWIAGIVLTFYMTMMVIGLIKGLFGKESRDRVINGIGKSCTSAGEALGDFISDKLNERRERKEAERNQRPDIMIR